MKILHVAKHNSGDNDDEGSIGYAFEQLGHEVIRIHERQAPSELGVNHRADFLLFHHCDRQLPSILAYKHCPLVFWTFDLFSSNDEQLRPRMLNHQAWLAKCLPHISLGFMTDGDTVAQDASGKLHHLMQGADERFVGYGTPGVPDIPEIIFTGTSKHGLVRQQHIKELQDRYGDRFKVIGEDGPKNRKHGRELADIFSTAKIVIAPDGPCTDLYWSNRVYLTLGLGGFLLHPYCDKLRDHYSYHQLATYQSRGDLTSQIDFFLEADSAREDIRAKGYRATVERNLYRHRCEKMIEIIKEKLL